MGWAYCPLNLIDSGRGIHLRYRMKAVNIRHSESVPHGAFKRNPLAPFQPGERAGQTRDVCSP
jgi:hypothetical protein